MLNIPDRLGDGRVFQAIQTSEMRSALGVSEFLDASIMDSDVVRKAIRNELKAQLKANHIAIPTFQYFRKNMCPSVDEKLASLYKKVMVGEGVGCEGIEASVQIAQGALYDGVMFVYDSKYNTYCLASCNFDVLTGLGISRPQAADIIENNRRGILTAYKIDVYFWWTEGYDDLDYKGIQDISDFAIDEVKPDKDVTKRFTLVPYQFVQELMLMMEAQISEGKILQVTHVENGVRNTCFVSENFDLRDKYCDAEVMGACYVEVGVRFYVDLGLIGIPSIGTSSLSSGLADIDVFGIEAISVVDESTMVKAGVTKPKTPVRDLAGELLVHKELAKYYASGDNRFKSICNSLSSSKKIVVSADMMTVDTIMTFLRHASSKSREALYKLCGLVERVDKLEAYLSNILDKPVEFDFDNMQDLLEEDLDRVLIRFTVQKVRGHVYVVYCTNNENLLRAVYGDSSVASSNSPLNFKKFYGWLKENWNPEEVSPSEIEVEGMLKKYNLSSEGDLAIKIIRTCEEANSEFDEDLYETLEELFQNLGSSESGEDVDNIVAFHEDAKNEGATGNVGHNGFEVRTLTALPDANNVYHNYKGIIDPWEVWFNGEGVIGADLYYLDKEE